MSRIKDLIKKLWEGNISSAESKELEDLIANNDSEFRNDLEKQFYASISSKEHHQGNSGQSKVVSFLSYSWKVAASLIIGTLFIQLYIQQNNKSSEPHSVNSHEVATMPASELIIRSNRTPKDMQIVLSDGSEVILSPASSIQYKKLFDFDKRNVSLTGKAFFKVQKNAAKPFSVITGGFATTALGTSFEVNTLVFQKLVVRLYTGKVKVYSRDSTSKFHTVYLTPKQLVSINTNDGTIIQKSRFYPAEKPIIKADLPVKKLNNMDFENEPLAKVFNKLSSIYNLPIDYNKEQVEGLYFTGSVLPTDSIINIINLIANMNGLTVEHEGEHFVIKKK